VNVVSTIPLASTVNDTYYINQVINRVTTTPPIPEVTLDPVFLASPPPEPATGSIRTDVSGQLFSCGLASSVCEGAAGKICLIQRGGTPFRDKVKNCMDGGGIGTLIYNREDLPGCQHLDGITVGATDQFGDPLPADRVPTMALARVQGEALLRALQSGMQLTASIRFPVLPPQTDVGLGLLSGTSEQTMLLQQRVLACSCMFLHCCVIFFGVVQCSVCKFFDLSRQLLYFSKHGAGTMRCCMANQSAQQLALSFPQVQSNASQHLPALCCAVERSFSACRHGYTRCCWRRRPGMVVTPHMQLCTASRCTARNSTDAARSHT
jgi:hypothetical protein